MLDTKSPSPCIVDPDDSIEHTALARKRRKLIMQGLRSHRVDDPEDPIVDFNSPSTCTASTMDCTIIPETVFEGVACTVAEDDEESNSKTTNPAIPMTVSINVPVEKKTQVRYDPEVPMSKEEVAAWRKEERRKRNRESAAASRQRTRDRIMELEDEVNEWKSKFEDAMKRISDLEELAKARKVVEDTSSQTFNVIERCNYNGSVPDSDLSFSPVKVISSVSPFSSPCQSPCHSPSFAALLPLDPPEIIYENKDVPRQTLEEEMHLTEISRPASSKFLYR